LSWYYWYCTECMRDRQSLEPYAGEGNLEDLLDHPPQWKISARTERARWWLEGGGEVIKEYFTILEGKATCRPLKKVAND
jgi:hypothetical protein